MDSQAYKSAMAAFPSGVTIVTAFAPDGSPVGLTLSAMCSASLRPAALLVCLDHLSETMQSIARTETFSVNILAAGHGELVTQFASKRKDKFAGVNWSRPVGGRGGPLLLGATAAYAVCATDRIVDIGDHRVVFGTVLEAGADVRRSPLVYCRRDLRPWDALNPGTHDG